MLLRRVVSTPWVGKIVSLSVPFSAVPCSGGQHPRPLGPPLPTPPHPPRLPRYAPHMPTLFLSHLHSHAPLVHRTSHAARCRYHLRTAVRCTIYYSTPIASAL